MTRRERLTRCYFNQETDRPAVFSRRGFPADDPTYAKLIALIDSKTDLKGGWCSSVIEEPLPIQCRTEPHSEDWERRIETLETPAGTLTRTSLVSLKGQAGLHESYFIKSPADAEAFLTLPLPTLGGDTAAFFAADASMGDAGIVEASIGFNPGGYAAELCGSETFALLSVTDRDLLHRLCERQMTIIQRRVSYLLAAGVGPFFCMLGEEYIVPPLHGPRDFQDFNVRYDKPIIDLLHEGGALIHVHSHGSIKHVFQGFIDAGVDVLHPFEPPPQGNITAREAKAMARGKLCLEGNIQIHRMYEATPDEIRTETAQLIADAFDDGKGLIVSPTASPYIRGQGEICFPRYQGMIDTVLRSSSLPCHS